MYNIANKNGLIAMTTNNDSKMQEHLKLRYNALTGCPNLITWMKEDMPAYCKMYKDIKPWMVQVIYDREIPAELTANYVSPLNVSTLNAIELKIEESKAKKYLDKQDEWNEKRTIDYRIKR